MKVTSLNVALPRLIQWKGETFPTGIFKQPVEGRVQLCTLNFDGDQQADLSVHGGPFKAVYGYPSEHYTPWRAELPGIAMDWGMFGENLTTEGLSEPDVFIGDVYRVGTARLRVTQPRTPCFKLAAKFQRDDMLKRFLVSGRSGFYFAVEQEGDVAAGDGFELVERDADSMSIAQINDLYTHRDRDIEGLRMASQLPGLPEAWRRHFRGLVDDQAEPVRAGERG
jgi:MOSC domain-containing protein YiiM